MMAVATVAPALLLLVYSVSAATIRYYNTQRTRKRGYSMLASIFRLSIPLVRAGHNDQEKGEEPSNQRDIHVSDSVDHAKALS